MRSTSHFFQAIKKNATMTGASVCRRIAAFELAASEALDPQVLASKISSKSDRKKYDFASGLKRDLRRTRAALRDCSGRHYSNEGSPVLACKFLALFEYTGGQIANLNRILQNLKEQNEASFEPECFFVGVNDDELIILLDKFWKEEYDVDCENVFRPANTNMTQNVERDQRRGRSYEEENLQSLEQDCCLICRQFVQSHQRLAIRACVYHIHCLQCAGCGAPLSKKMDFVSFDGNVLCSVTCIRLYDAQHIRQQRK
jgi:hypothetical protein